MSRQRSATLVSQDLKDPFKVLGITLSQDATRIDRVQVQQAYNTYRKYLSILKDPKRQAIVDAYTAFLHVYGEGKPKKLNLTRSCPIEKERVFRKFEELQQKRSGKKTSPSIAVHTEIVENQPLEHELREQLAQLRAENDRLRAALAAAQQLSNTEQVEHFEAQLSDNLVLLQVTEAQFFSDPEDSAIGSDHERSSSFSSCEARTTVSSFDGYYEQNEFDADAESLNGTAQDAVISLTPVVFSEAVITDTIVSTSQSKKFVPYAESPYLKPLEELKDALEVLKNKILYPHAVAYACMADQVKEVIEKVLASIAEHTRWSPSKESTHVNLAKGIVKKGIDTLSTQVTNVLNNVEKAVASIPIAPNALSGISKAIAVVKAILINIATVGLVNVTKDGRKWVASFFKLPAPQETTALKRDAVKERSEAVRSLVDRLASVGM